MCSYHESTSKHTLQGRASAIVGTRQLIGTLSLIKA